MKKVIRIKNSKFVKQIQSMSVVTCDHIKDAEDVSNLSFDTLRGVVNRLRELGYNETTIVEVK